MIVFNLSAVRKHCVCAADIQHLTVLCSCSLFSREQNLKTSLLNPSFSANVLLLLAWIFQGIAIFPGAVAPPAVSQWNSMTPPAGQRFMVNVQKEAKPIRVDWFTEHSVLTVLLPAAHDFFLLL